MTHMIESQTATVTSPVSGLSHFSFPHHKCILSVAYKSGSYATFVAGDRFSDTKDQHIPLTYELAVFNEDSELIQITSHDTVAAYQRVDMIQTILDKMGREDFNIKDLELFCD